MVSEENDYQIISLLTESRISTQRLQVVDDRDSVVAPGLEHPGHQLPLQPRQPLGVRVGPRHLRARDLLWGLGVELGRGDQRQVVIRRLKWSKFK